MDTEQEQAVPTQAQPSPLRRFLTRAQILAAKPGTFDDVPVPEWGEGGEVRVVSPSGNDKDEFEDAIVTIKKELGKHGRVKVSRETVMKGARAKVAVISCRHPETGERIFNDDDIEALGEMPGGAAPLDRIFQSWMHMAGMTEADLEQLGNDSTRARKESSISGSR